jgi:hypothetical protein
LYDDSPACQEDSDTWVGVRIFDKGFCLVPVLIFKTLKRRKIKFIPPIPVRGKSGGIRKLFEATASHKTSYTFNSSKHGELEVSAVVIKKYSKARYKRKGTRRFAYVVAGLTKVCRTTPSLWDVSSTIWD